MISYVKGDATAPIGTGVKMIAHVTNTNGGWGAPRGARGFVQAISKKWPEPERRYRAHPESQELGQNQYVYVGPDLWVVNMCAQRGYASRQYPLALDYAALRICLDQLSVGARELNASVHCPRIGCGLGGGRWPDVERLLTQRLVANGIRVTVYDL